MILGSISPKALRSEIYATCLDPPMQAKLHFEAFQMRMQGLGPTGSYISIAESVALDPAFNTTDLASRATNSLVST